MTWAVREKGTERLLFACRHGVCSVCGFLLHGLTPGRGPTLRCPIDAFWLEDIGVRWHVNNAAMAGMTEAQTLSQGNLLTTGVVKG